jgi:hypothetical protein
LPPWFLRLLDIASLIGSPSTPENIVPANRLDRALLCVEVRGQGATDHSAVAIPGGPVERGSNVTLLTRKI